VERDTLVFDTGLTLWVHLEIATRNVKVNRRILDGVSEHKPPPVVHKLEQSYPNPFNSSTTITYQLPAVSHVMLKVYDILGREVTTLVNETKYAGSYTVNWDASRISSGVYFYRINAGRFTDTKKLLFLR